MVLNACRRQLSNRQDAEDAFQATFLILAKKAGSVRWADSIAGWLYLVAGRVAARARKKVNQRQQRERETGKVLAKHSGGDADADAGLAEVIDQELAQLPERYRTALVLCCLEGKSGEEAARELGRPVGTIWYQLSRGRELLRGRLASRGVVVTGAALGTYLTQQATAASLPSALAGATLKGAALLGVGKAIGAAGIQPTVAVLMNGTLQSMVVTKVKVAVAFVMGFLVLGASVGLVVKGIPSATAPVPEKPGSSRVIGYFAEWSVYDRKFHVADIPADKLTHVNYAFAKISERGECDFFDRFAAIEKAYPDDGGGANGVRGNFRQLQLLKQKHPRIRVMLSVGGWTLSSPFSDAALTEESRGRLAQSCVGFMKKYGFDGLDIDWEYPVGGGLASNRNRPEDRHNYTLLLAELRRQLDAQEKAEGKRYQLTIAAPAGPANIANLELEKIAPLVDWFNVMAYDFHGSWSEQTNFHAPLFGSSTDPAPADAPQRKYNVAAAVQAYRQVGVPSDKIVVGLPFFGRGWGGVPDRNNGLYQPHDRKPPQGTWEPGVWDYKDLAANYVGKFQRHWHEEAQSPWLYDPGRGILISFDDPESIRLKAGYIRRENLGGAMVWELSGDDRNFSLLRAVHEGLDRD